MFKALIKCYTLGIWFVETFFDGMESRASVPSSFISEPGFG